VPTLGFTALAALQLLAIMVVANRVSGGLVAFQLALNFFYLPTAIVTWPIARAILPQLSRLHHSGDERLFHDELRRAVAVASFVIIPTAFAYAALSTQLADVLALGQLGRGDGPRLMALSLAALAPGVVGDGWFTLGTYAFYARHDARSPVHSMGIRVGVALCCMAMAWLVRGSAVLVLLGAAISLGSVVGAVHAGWRLRRRLPPTKQPLLIPLARTVVASLIMVVSLHLAALALGGLPQTKPAQLLALAFTALIGAVVFLGVQVAFRAPELGWLKQSLIPRRIRARSRR
jgi:putative peptidoglycan lipid II flippase